MTGDSVDHPSHYAEGRKYEPIVVIEAWGLGFNLGNALKYISRAGRKDPAKIEEDLRKAVWYIDRELSKSLFERFLSRMSRWLLRRKLKGRIGPNDVTTDWKLPSYPSFAIVSIYEGTRPYLKSAVAILEYEIDHLHREG